MAYVLVPNAFTPIYVEACTTIEACYEDISMNIVRLNKNIRQQTTIKNELKEFIELHLNCYR